MSSEPEFFTLLSWGDIMEAGKAEDDLRQSLPPSDPRHPDMYVFQDNGGTLSLFWGGYPYTLEVEPLKDPLKFAFFLSHIAEKNWEHATALRIGELSSDLFGRGSFQ